jgi:hypothetical protein
VEKAAVKSHSEDVARQCAGRLEPWRGSEQVVWSSEKTCKNAESSLRVREKWWKNERS